MTTEVDRAVAQLLELDAWEARLLARRDGRYVIAIRRQGQTGTWLELGTDSAGTGFRTEPDVRDRLADAGFERERRGPMRVWIARDSDGAGSLQERQRATSQRLQEALDLLGAAPGETAVDITVEAQTPPHNPKLIEAMRAVARSAEVPARQALYAALANAELVVPIDPETLDGPPDQHAPLVLEDFEGGPVFAVFSDVDALRGWRHEGHPWAGVHGVDFFAHAQRAGVTSVRVNPDGEIGGELYRNEVAAIVEGIRKFHGSTMN